MTVAMGRPKRLLVDFHVLPGDKSFSIESSELNDEDSHEGDIEEPRTRPPAKPAIRKPGSVKVLLDSVIPQDLRDNAVGIIKVEYVVEKKTLLHHAATSDFGRRRPAQSVAH
jgi:hypothetical protein